MMSVGPAGENGTITLTACAGYSLPDWAAALCARSKPASTSAAAKNSRRALLFMHSSLDFSVMLPLLSRLGQLTKRLMLHSQRSCPRKAGTHDLRPVLMGPCLRLCSLSCSHFLPRGP